MRELRNVVQRAAILGPRTGAGTIGVADLGLPDSQQPPFAVAIASPPAAAAPAAPPRLADGERTPDEDEWPRVADNDDTPGDLLCLAGRTFESIERAVLAWALARNGGSRRRAARALGIPRSTFCDKVKRYGAV